MNITARALGLAFLVLFALGAVSGLCAQNAGVPVQEADAQRLPSSRVQREVMDFSDAYASAVRHAIDDYARQESDPAKRVAAQAWKVRFISSAMTIAASSDPNQNLLDMVVFISAGKWAVNSYWIPKVFGKNATGLRDVYATMDREIWAMADRVLTPPQQKSLRKLISEWKESNPSIYEVSDARLRNLEGFHPGDFDKDASAKGILANLRKALGRVDTSLLYGERMMFYMERTPRILTQQTDLTLAQIAQDFPLATLEPEHFSVLLEKLPGQLQEGINKNQDVIREVLPEFHATLDSAGRLTENLNVTLQHLAVFSKNEGNSPLKPEDVTSLLKEANVTLAQFHIVINDLNALLAEDAGNPSNAVKLATLLDERSDHLMTKAYHRALILLAAFFAGMILLLVAIKILFFRRQISA